LHHSIDFYLAQKRQLLGGREEDDDDEDSEDISGEENDNLEALIPTQRPPNTKGNIYIFYL
jgi:hypothetical protein